MTGAIATADGEFVVARRDAPPIFETAEGALDEASVS